MSVIFTRAPLRLSMGGGGTDLPSYSERRGGFLIGGAIDKYIYLITHTVFQRRTRSAQRSAYCDSTVMRARTSSLRLVSCVDKGQRPYGARCCREALNLCRALGATPK